MKPRAMAKGFTAVILALAAIAAPASSQCVKRPPTLISLWTADGTAEDLMHESDGTLEGGMGYSVGKVGQAFTFDGIDDFVCAGDGPGLRCDFPFSVDFWMYRTSDEDFYGVASTNTSDHGLYSGFRVYVNVAGAVVTGIGNDLGCCSPDFRRNFFSPDGVVPQNTWRHIAVVFESATSHLIYVDGALQATTQEGLATSMSFGASNQLDLGRVFDPNIGGDHYGSGKLDEVGLYRGMLQPDEIDGIFSAGSNGQCRDAVAVTPSNWGAIKARYPSQ